MCQHCSTGQQRNGQGQFFPALSHRKACQEFCYFSNVKYIFFFLLCTYWAVKYFHKITWKKNFFLQELSLPWLVSKRVISRLLCHVQKICLWNRWFFGILYMSKTLATAMLTWWGIHRKVKRCPSEAICVFVWNIAYCFQNVLHLRLRPRATYLTICLNGKCSGKYLWLWLK